MNVAFIPVRGGSKSIPFKNIKPICGKPLVYWVAQAANNCQSIDKVYIATDRLPILAEDDHVLWVMGYRISEYYKVTENTKRILKVQLIRKEFA